LKRLLAATTAALLSLSVTAPAVFAQTTATTSNSRFELNGTLITTGDSFSANGTVYVPVWYVTRVLRILGITSRWNGTLGVLNIDLPAWVPANLAQPAAAETDTNATVYVNGIRVLATQSIARVDPYTRHTTKIVTTYFPSADLFGLLRDLAIEPLLSAQALNLALELTVNGPNSLAVGGQAPYSLLWTNRRTGGTGTVPDALVNWTAEPSPGQIDGQGVFLAQHPGTYDVTANYADASPTAAVAVLAPAALTLSADPDLLLAGTDDTTALTASVVTADDQPVAGATVNFSSSSSGILTLSNASAVTNAAGQATITGVVGSPGTTVITATTAKLQAQTSVTVENSTITVQQQTPPPAQPVPATIVATPAPGTTTDITAGQSQPVTFTVRTANGQPIAGVPLVLGTTGSLLASDLTEQTAVTGPDGTVAVNYVDTVAGDQGDVTARVSDGSLSGSTGELEVVPGPPYSVTPTSVTMYVYDRSMMQADLYKTPTPQQGLVPGNTLQVTSDGNLNWYGVGTSAVIPAEPAYAGIPDAGWDAITFTVRDRYGNAVDDAPVYFELFTPSGGPCVTNPAAYQSSSATNPGADLSVFAPSWFDPNAATGNQTRTVTNALGEVTVTAEDGALSTALQGIPGAFSLLTWYGQELDSVSAYVYGDPQVSGSIDLVAVPTPTTSTNGLAATWTSTTDAGTTTYFATLRDDAEPGGQGQLLPYNQVATITAATGDGVPAAIVWPAAAGTGAPFAPVGNRSVTASSLTLPIGALISLLGTGIQVVNANTGAELTNFTLTLTYEAVDGQVFTATQTF